MNSNNNESYEILKYCLDNLDKEVESHILSLKNESEMFAQLIKKNLQAELLSLPDSIRKMTMDEFLQHCLEYDEINSTSTTPTTNSSNQQQQQSSSSTTTTTTQGNSGLSLTELLFSPGSNSGSIENNNSSNNTSIDSESINDIKQKVIDILNSPQLLLKKKGINSNNNNNNN